MKRNTAKQEQLLLSELQVLLAELRTHLSLVRTGAGMVVSTSSVGFLVFANRATLPSDISTYRLYLYSAMVLGAMFGLFIFLRSERKILAISRLIKAAEKRNRRIDKLMV